MMLLSRLIITVGLENVNCTGGFFLIGLIDVFVGETGTTSLKGTV